jgi:hypothetical protein
MDRPRVDSQDLVERIRRARPDSPGEPATVEPTVVERSSARKKLLDYINTRTALPRSFDQPRGGLTAWIKRPIKKLVARAIFAVLHRYLNEEQSYLENLAKLQQDQVLEIERLETQIGPALPELELLRERVDYLHHLLESRIERLEKREKVDGR